MSFRKFKNKILKYLLDEFEKTKYIVSIECKDTKYIDGIVDNESYSFDNEENALMFAFYKCIEIISNLDEATYKDCRKEEDYYIMLPKNFVVSYEDDRWTTLNNNVQFNKEGYYLIIYTNEYNDIDYDIEVKMIEHDGIGTDKLKKLENKFDHLCLESFGIK